MVPPQEIEGVAGPQVVQPGEVVVAERIQLVRRIDLDLRRVVQVGKPPGGHLADFVQRAVAEQADRLRVADQPILLGLGEFFDVRLEVVFQARQHNHGVGNRCR